MSLAEQWYVGHRAHSAQSQKRIDNAYKCLRIVREFYLI